MNMHYIQKYNAENIGALKKGFVSHFSEVMNWWKRWWRTREGPKDRAATTRWEKDYNLLECDRMALFDEYLEMGRFPVFKIVEFYSLMTHCQNNRTDNRSSTV